MLFSMWGNYLNYSFTFIGRWSSGISLFTGTTWELDKPQSQPELYLSRPPFPATLCWKWGSNLGWHPCSGVKYLIYLHNWIISGRRDSIGGPELGKIKFSWLCSCIQNRIHFYNCVSLQIPDLSEHFKPATPECKWSSYLTFWLIFHH